MGKYNWTINSLEAKRDYIKNLCSKEDDDLVKEIYYDDIEFLNNAINRNFEIKNGNMPKLMDLYKNAKDVLNGVEFLWDAYKDLSNTQYVDINLKSKRQTLSKEDLLTLTHDFFKNNTNRFFFGNFMKSFYRKNDHIRFEGSTFEKFTNSCIYSITSLKEQFIEIRRNYTISDPIACIHEYMHATSHNINPLHVYDYKNLYNELDTIFMEIIAADYLEKTFKNGQAILYKTEVFNEYSEKSTILNEIIDITKKEESTKEITKNKELKSMTNLDDFYLEQGLYSLNDDSIYYLTGYLYAIELYRVYKEDREKALYLLKKIILLDCDNNKQFYDQIKMLGVMPGFSVKHFERNLNEDVQKLTLKK